jgi:hypothetical protein
MSCGQRWLAVHASRFIRRSGRHVQPVPSASHESWPVAQPAPARSASAPSVFRACLACERRRASHWPEVARRHWDLERDRHTRWSVCRLESPSNTLPLGPRGRSDLRHQPCRALQSDNLRMRQQHPVNSAPGPSKSHGTPALKPAERVAGSNQPQAAAPPHIPPHRRLRLYASRCQFCPNLRPHVSVSKVNLTDNEFPILRSRFSHGLTPQKRAIVPQRHHRSSPVSQRIWRALSARPQRDRSLATHPK